MCKGLYGLTTRWKNVNSQCSPTAQNKAPSCIYFCYSPPDTYTDMIYSDTFLFTWIFLCVKRNDFSTDSIFQMRHNLQMGHHVHKHETSDWDWKVLTEVVNQDLNNFLHYQAYFCKQRSLPLLAIRKNADSLLVSIFYIQSVVNIGRKIILEFISVNNHWFLMYQWEFFMCCKLHSCCIWYKL